MYSDGTRYIQNIQAFHCSWSAAQTCVSDMYSDKSSYDWSYYCICLIFRLDWWAFDKCILSLTLINSRAFLRGERVEYIITLLSDHLSWKPTKALQDKNSQRERCYLSQEIKLWFFKGKHCRLKYHKMETFSCWPHRDEINSLTW